MSKKEKDTKEKKEKKEKEIKKPSTTISLADNSINYENNLDSKKIVLLCDGMKLIETLLEKNPYDYDGHFKSVKKFVEGVKLTYKNVICFFPGPLNSHKKILEFKERLINAHKKKEKLMTKS